MPAATPTEIPGDANQVSPSATRDLARGGNLAGDGSDPIADTGLLVAGDNKDAQDPSDPELLAPPRSLKPDAVPAPWAEGDPPPPSVRSLNLDQVIQTTILSDPVLRAGIESINQSSSDLLTSSLKPNPELFTDIQLLPLTRPFTVTAQGGPPQQDVIVGYKIDWFLFGKRAAAMQAASLNVRVTEAQYANQVRLRVMEAGNAYYDLLEAKALLALAKQDVENLQKVEAITEKAVEGGGRPQIELNRVRLDRLRSEQVLRDSRNNLVAAVAKIRSIMGQFDGDPDFDISGTLDDPIQLDTYPIDQAIQVARENRPDCQALGMRIAQADASVESERRKGYPTVTPLVGYTRQYQTKAIGFPDANSYSLAVSMTLPFYDRNQGNVAKAMSVVNQNQWELNAWLVSLRAEVIRVDQDLRTTSANARAVAGEQLKLAEQVRDSINKAYEAGGRPLIDVLDAQRNYRETYRQFITSRAGYGRAVVNYNGTLGKQVASP